MTRGYTKVSHHAKRQLIEKYESKELGSLKMIAKHMGINYENAKRIVRLHKQGQDFRPNSYQSGIEDSQLTTFT